MAGDKIIVIPVYNEADTIPLLIPEIFKYCPDASILIVDDNSPDGTGGIVEKMAGNDNRIRYMHRRTKDGIGPAYIEGFGEALRGGYSYFLQMDADFSHDPKYIPELFRLAEKYDLVIGSRYVPGGGIENWGIVRKAISRFGSLYAKLILGIPVNDLTGGFKCYKRGVLESIDLDKVSSKGYAFQIETTYRAYRKGFSIKEHPIIFTDRRVGRTKMSRSIVLEAIIAVWKIRFFVMFGRKR